MRAALEGLDALKQAMRSQNLVEGWPAGLSRERREYKSTIVSS
jgi:hypothetical protein